jgi:hypothetical protein
VEAASDTGALQWLLFGILRASGHQAWHFIFGQLNLAAAERGKADISNLELVGWSRHGEGDFAFELFEFALL